MTFNEWWNNYDLELDPIHPKTMREVAEDSWKASFAEGIKAKVNTTTISDAPLMKSDDKDVIINFLKKELIKKTYCRQVMKRQYRELKQKYESLLKDFNLIKSCNNCKHHHVGGCPYAQTKDCNWKNKKHWELCK